VTGVATGVVGGPAGWHGAAFEAALAAVLHTPRLRLEPQAEHHAEGLFALLGDAQLYTHIPQEPPVSLQALRERLAWLSARRSPKGDELWLNWVLCDASQGGYIGRVQATVRGDAPAYIAYEVFPAFWHRGYATEACIRMIRWLINDLHIEHFTAEVDSLNAASLRLLERLGFQRVVLRQNAEQFKGRSSDEWMLRLAAVDFLRQRAAQNAPAR
jgi:[ribosomal protein S5]-alanine N-acetyltransferase